MASRLNEMRHGPPDKVLEHLETLDPLTPAGADEMQAALINAFSRIRRIEEQQLKVRQAPVHGKEVPRERP